MTSQRRRSVVLGSAAVLSLPGTAWTQQNFSDAERALFMSPHLKGLRPPMELKYRFDRSGTLEDAFTEAVTLHLTARADGRCCAATAEFLTGARRLDMPDLDAAEGNPVLLYFLERDIREMSRRTKGQPNYFRKRIRMAIFQGASVREVTASYLGKPLAARQFVVAPYLDDPLRIRFEALANKRYFLTLSDAVPGAIVALRSQIEAPQAGAAPLVVEQLLLEGATAPSST
jgi:hypothetical protein